jgi:hypothetical protein
MSGIMMTVFVRLLHSCFVFLLIILHLGNKIPHQITSKWKKCPDVTLIDRSNEDCSTTN